MPIYSNKTDWIYPRGTMPIFNKKGELDLPKENGWYREILLGYLHNNGWVVPKLKHSPQLYKKGAFKIWLCMNTLSIGYEGKKVIYDKLPLRTVVSKGITYYLDEITATLFEEHL